MRLPIITIVDCFGLAAQFLSVFIQMMLYMLGIEILSVVHTNPSFFFKEREEKKR